MTHLIKTCENDIIWRDISCLSPSLVKFIENLQFILVYTFGMSTVAPSCTSSTKTSQKVYIPNVHSKEVCKRFTKFNTNGGGGGLQYMHSQSCIGRSINFCTAMSLKSLYSQIMDLTPETYHHVSFRSMYS